MVKISQGGRSQVFLNHSSWALLTSLWHAQVQNFIAGIKPIQSIIRIGSAAGQLLAIPAEALRGKPDSFSQKSRAVAGNVPMSRQLQRGIFGESATECQPCLPALHLLL